MSNTATPTAAQIRKTLKTLKGSESMKIADLGNHVSLTARKVGVNNVAFEFLFPSIAGEPCTVTHYRLKSLITLDDAYISDTIEDAPEKLKDLANAIRAELGHKLEA